MTFPYRTTASEVHHRVIVGSGQCVHVAADVDCCALLIDDSNLAAAAVGGTYSCVGGLEWNRSAELMPPHPGAWVVVLRFPPAKGFRRERWNAYSLSVTGGDQRA